MREKLRVHQTRVRHIDPTVLIENEEDLGDFPPEQTYTFIKETSYDVLSEKEQKIIKGNLFTMIWHIMTFINVVINYRFEDDVEAQMEIYKCFEDSECGNCTTLFHMTNDLHWHGSRGVKEKTERPVHYLSNKIQHPSKYRIVECTEKCFCFNTSCTNRAVANLKDNPFPFAKEFKF